MSSPPNTQVDEPWLRGRSKVRSLGPGEGGGKEWEGGDGLGLSEAQ
jgi:hypothetical protein